MIIDRFNKFVSLLKIKEPGLKISYKNESKFMKFLGLLLFFNKNFMTEFVTTIGKTIYFPSKEIVEKALDYKWLSVLAHEFIHISDYKKNPLFTILYLFPLVLAPTMLLFMLKVWWLGLMLFVIFLLPLPAIGRMMYEVRGYTMTLVFANEVYKEQKLSDENIKTNLSSLANELNIYFTGSTYYFMWPFGVKKKLAQAVEQILEGKLSESLYVEILQDFKDSRNY